MFFLVNVDMRKLLIEEENWNEKLQKKSREIKIININFVKTNVVVF